MPADVIDGRVDEDTHRHRPDRRRAAPGPRRARARSDGRSPPCKTAEKPLVIVGKGMAWSRAEDEVRQFIDRTQVPFLASPMGKGVVPDDHPLSVGAARSHALQEADVILLVGARLNWIMHFGQQPRFNPNVKVLQLDIHPEQIGHNVPAAVALVGDGKADHGSVQRRAGRRPVAATEADSPWRRSIAEKIAENEDAVAGMAADDSAPMNYYRAFRDIAEWLRPDDLIIGEGANTMDIGRTQMPNTQPPAPPRRRQLRHHGYRSRVRRCRRGRATRAGGWCRSRATPPSASAAWRWRRSVATSCRSSWSSSTTTASAAASAELPEDGPPPPNVYLPGARYEKIAEAFGAGAFYVEDPAELRAALDAAAALSGPAIVHVRLDPASRPQAPGPRLAHPLRCAASRPWSSVTSASGSAHEPGLLRAPRRRYQVRSIAVGEQQGPGQR